MVRKDRAGETSTKRNGRPEPNAPIQIALWTPTPTSIVELAAMLTSTRQARSRQKASASQGRKAAKRLPPWQSDSRSLLLGFLHLLTRVPLRHLDGRAASYGWYSSAEAYTADF